MAFTPEQQKAVSDEGSLIVSAGAGSGKTTVMIARIVEKLKAGANLDEMLIVTFTRAAAASIKTKLVEELKKLKDNGFASIAAHALDALPVSNIGTLHSFCQRLIKTYFYAAGIDPSATVCEDGEAGLYKRAAVRAAVDDAVSKKSAYFSELYEALRARRGDDGFIETVENIADFALSMPDPDAYLGAQATDGQRLSELESIFTKRYRALEKNLNGVRASAAAMNATKIEAACGDLAAYIKGNIPIDAVARTSVKKTDGENISELNERFKAVKADCKAFVSDCEVARAAAKLESSDYTAAVKAVAADALERYKSRKQALCKLDYSDLEHGALRVLEDGSISAELAQKIKFVFIDEFQDVNPLQAKIADKLAGLDRAEVFYVGDIKQSIYGFRRCSPEFFRNKLNDKASNKIVLNMNFRSSLAVVDLVNKVFEPLMTEDFGGVDYKNERLIPRPHADAGEAGIYIIEDGEYREEKETASEIYSVKNATASIAIDPEAVFVTKSILDYIQEDDKRTFSSVAVLVRSLGSKFCGDLRKLFVKYGIPAHFGKNPPLSEGAETKALLDILRCVDNRYDDLALYTALRSPMGKFSDSELLEIAKIGERLAVKNKIEPAKSSGRKAYAFWQKAAEYRGGLKARLDAFYALRDEFSKFALIRDAADALGHITSRIDYFRHVYDNFGQDAAAKTEAFINAAAGMDCHSFIKLCDDTDFCLDAGSGGDAVTVMTMHGSKGLEYDFVIVADTAHRFNMSDSTDRVIISDGGVCVKIPDVEQKKLLPSVSWLVENAALPVKLKQEELRLLYVALTRAQKKLTVCGKRRGVGKPDCMLGFIPVDNIGYTSVIDPIVERSEERIDELPVNEDIVKAVKERIGYEYASGAELVKTSVTKLSDDSERDENAFVPVLFDDAEEVKYFSGGDARERGTLYHKAMELIDFDDPDYDALVHENGMDSVDMNVIKRAVSALRRLTDGAAYCFKERYFIADMPRKEVTGEGEDNILVQGVIDLLILDGKGGAVIVDYKTTRLDKLFSAGYVKQLGLYVKAVERTGALKVKGAYLYSFVNGELYEVNVRKQ